MANEPASSTTATWIMAERYMRHIVSIRDAVDINKRALRNLKESIGLRGYRISDKVTGTKATDSLEASTLELMERMDRIKEDLPRFEADLKEAMRPIQKLSKADQALIEREYLTPKTATLALPYRKAKQHSVIDGIELAEQILAPRRAMERLYEVLPPEWKIPKAL